MRKGAGGDASRSFKLIHQTLCITSIDFQRKCIFGFVELNILPLASNLTRIKLNGKQWIRIYRVCMKEERQRDWLDVGFQFDDPNKTVCQDNKKRNLEYFISSQQAAVAATEKDGGGGEITIKIPKELLNYVSDKRVLQISIEFSLEHPDGGIQFVTPEGSGTLAERSCHMFTCGLANSSRLWFPCVDSYSEVCTWNIDVTVSQDMVCVSCGELTDQVLTPDERRKTYHYVLNIPTAAPNIAVAVGPFVVHVDPVMPEVTHFCLPGLLPALKHSTQFLSEVFEFYEECLSSRYPYTYYKQVFVDQAYMPASSYASMTIFSTNLLHSVKVIDQTFETRQVLAHSLAEQFFGVYLSMQTWADAWLPISISGYLFGLFIKRSFGNNEYRHWIHKEVRLAEDIPQQVKELWQRNSDRQLRRRVRDAISARMEEGVARRMRFVNRRNVGGRGDNLNYPRPIQPLPPPPPQPEHPPRSPPPPAAAAAVVAPPPPPAAAAAVVALPPPLVAAEAVVAAPPPLAAAAAVVAAPPPLAAAPEALEPRRRQNLSQLVRQNQENYGDYMTNQLPQLLARLDESLRRLEQDLDM